MRISVTAKGDSGKTTGLLTRLLKGDQFAYLDHYGRLGVEALRAATPIDTGQAASSWAYRVIRGRKPGIVWYNTDTEAGGTLVIILIQYGHGTGTGGYVHGRDIINPAMRGVFDQIADDVWKRVIT